MKKDIEALEWSAAAGYEDVPECIHPHEPNRILKPGEPVKLVNSYGVNWGVSWGPKRNGLKEVRKAATESLNTHKADGAAASSSQGEN